MCSFDSNQENTTKYPTRFYNGVLLYTLVNKRYQNMPCRNKSERNEFVYDETHILILGNIIAKTMNTICDFNLMNYLGNASDPMACHVDIDIICYMKRIYYI